MTNVRLTRELTALGLEYWDIRRLVRGGQLERVRRGAYAAPLPADASALERHRSLIAGTLPYLDAGAVLSHGSAAVLHGLPTWSSWLERVHVTRSRSTGGQRRPRLHVHVAPLADEVEIVDGVAVTTVSRTVLDLARSIPFDRAVAVADRALAMGLPRDELIDGTGSMSHWPGVRRARMVSAFASADSESVGESRSRVRCVEQGLPAPTLQYRVLDAAGGLLARCDFGWEEFGTVGEFDGRVKYGRLLKPGQRPEDVVYEEKLREDAVRDRGWQVVRWTWADLDRPGVIGDRVRRAFERASRAGHPASIPSR